jgi:hypothetical protein
MRVRELSVALLAAVALAACAPAQPSPSPLPSPVATATPTTAPATEPPMTVGPIATPADTGTAGTPPCELADLKASHGLVDAGAGSRFTEVVLVSATTCSLDAFPALGLRDAGGAPLVSAPSAGPGAIDLVSGVAYTSNVRLGNWCPPEPAFPLQLELITAAGELPVTGGSFPDEGDMPPCNGAGGPILDGTAWVPTA